MINFNFIKYKYIRAEWTFEETVDYAVKRIEEDIYNETLNELKLEEEEEVEHDLNR